MSEFIGDGDATGIVSQSYERSILDEVTEKDILILKAIVAVVEADTGMKNLDKNQE